MRRSLRRAERSDGSGGSVLPAAAGSLESAVLSDISGFLSWTLEPTKAGFPRNSASYLRTPAGSPAKYPAFPHISLPEAQNLTHPERLGAGPQQPREVD